jgi:hypothetical protein
MRKRTMANRNNVNTQAAANDDDDDIDDLPSEISGDETKPSTDARANGEMVTGGLSVEELDERGFNDDRDEAERLKLDAPPGDWFKRERWEFEKRVYANDSMPDDLDPSGRTFFIFKGTPESRVANGGMVYEPAMYLRVSPDIRYKQDKPDQVDMAYKLFLRCKDLYLDIKGERATARKLIDFLSEDEYTVRTMKGDNSPIIVDVKKTVQRRR